MTPLYKALINDLIDDNFEMLHHHEEPPNGVSLYTGMEPSPEVQYGLETLLTKLQCDTYTDKTPYLNWLHKGGIKLDSESLVIILMYPTEKQRILELKLSDTRASLHFIHK